MLREHALANGNVYERKILNLENTDLHLLKRLWYGFSNVEVVVLLRISAVIPGVAILGTGVLSRVHRTQLISPAHSTDGALMHPYDGAVQQNQILSTTYDVGCLPGQGVDLKDHGAFGFAESELPHVPTVERVNDRSGFPSLAAMGTASHCSTVPVGVRTIFSPAEIASYTGRGS